jgi:DNA modification methylase
MAAPVTSRQSLAEFLATLPECRDKRSLTHGLHPYPAKFIPHIPRRLIAMFSRPGDVVLDPMCGSGTAVVEATVAGRVGLGADLNPIACLVSRAKTTVLSDQDERELAQLHQRLQLLERVAASPSGVAGLAARVALPDFKNRDHWFDLHVSVELSACLAEIERMDAGRARAVARCAFSAVIVAVSRQESETRWAARSTPMEPGATIRRLANRLGEAVRRLRDYSGAVRTPDAVILRSDARRLPLPAGSVDLVVTSPPYANSHDYYLYNKLRMFWLGHDVVPVQDAEFGSRNKHSDLKMGVEHYVRCMHSVFAEIHRVLRVDGLAVVVVGDAVIRGVFYDMAAALAPAASAAGLALSDSQAFLHKRFTSAFNAGFGTDREKRTHVIVLRRD